MDAASRLLNEQTAPLQAVLPLMGTVASTDRDVESPERYTIEQGRLVRTVEQRNGVPVKTDFGPAPDAARDLAAVADARYLRLPQRPADAAGEPPLRIVDLFCGAGALSLGAVEAARALGRSAHLELAVDERAPALNVYRETLEAPEAVRQVDLAQTLNGTLGAEPTTAEQAFLHTCSTQIDVLLAGAPCQGHSTLNNHTRHDDDRNDLYLRAVRFVDLRRPRLCIFENVRSVVSDQRRSVERAVGHLRSLGYHVDVDVVPLDRLGVPQRRRRHVLLAAAPGTPQLKVKQVVNAYAVLRPADRTVRWAIGDLAGLRVPDAFDRPSRPSALNRHRMRLLIREGWTDLPNPHRPHCHRRAKTDGNGAPREHTYKSMYGRLDWDRPAQTITSGYGSMGQGRYVHPARPRTITPHEAARLQFMPDFFRFESVGRRSEWATMIGNAAPMKLAYVLVLEALR